MSINSKQEAFIFQSFKAGQPVWPAYKLTKYVFVSYFYVYTVMYSKLA